MNSNDVNAQLGTAHLPPDTVLSFFYDLREERWGFDVGVRLVAAAQAVIAVAARAVRFNAKTKPPSWTAASVML